MNRTAFLLNKKKTVEEKMPSDWKRKEETSDYMRWTDGYKNRLTLHGKIEEKGKRFWYIDKDHYQAIEEDLLYQLYEPE
jgi:hypothetical protein